MRHEQADAFSNQNTAERDPSDHLRRGKQVLAILHAILSCESRATLGTLLHRPSYVSINSRTARRIARTSRRLSTAALL